MSASKRWKAGASWTWKRWGLAFVAGELDDIDHDYGIWCIVGPLTFWCGREEVWE